MKKVYEGRLLLQKRLDSFYRMEKLKKINLFGKFLVNNELRFSKPSLNFLRTALVSGILPEGNPMGVHYFVFIPAFMSLATQKQQDKWLQKCLNAEIIGTFAQTELGHGTFIRGLETTSTYDPKTKEFVINSPTITAYKVFQFIQIASLNLLTLF